MKIEVKDKIWKYEDYSRLEDDKSISDWIEFVMRKFVDEGLGEIINAPFDVILSENIVVQPDIVFVSKDKLKNTKEGRLFSYPDLVYERIQDSFTKGKGNRGLVLGRG